jgi:hypothetical protein
MAPLTVLRLSVLLPESMRRLPFTVDTPSTVASESIRMRPLTVLKLPVTIAPDPTDILPLTDDWPLDVSPAPILTLSFTLWALAGSATLKARTVSKLTVIVLFEIMLFILDLPLFDQFIGSL